MTDSAVREMTCIELIDQAVRDLLSARAQAQRHEANERKAARERERRNEVTSALRDWCVAAGWKLLSTSDMSSLALIAQMRSTHCSERSYADLRASGGLPEAQDVYTRDAEAVLEKILGELYVTLSILMKYDHGIRGPLEARIRAAIDFASIRNPRCSQA